MTPTNEQIIEVLKPLLDAAKAKNPTAFGLGLQIDETSALPWITFRDKSSHTLSHGYGTEAINLIEDAAATANRKMTEARRKIEEAEAELAALQSAEQKTV